MTPHTHRTYVEGCYRCELNKDEVKTDTLRSHIEEIRRDPEAWDEVYGDDDPLTLSLKPQTSGATTSVNLTTGAGRS